MACENSPIVLISVVLPNCDLFSVSIRENSPEVFGIGGFVHIERPPVPFVVADTDDSPHVVRSRCGSGGSTVGCRLPNI
jgi:hypothetical protein